MKYYTYISCYLVFRLFKFIKEVASLKARDCSDQKATNQRTVVLSSIFLSLRVNHRVCFKGGGMASGNSMLFILMEVCDARGSQRADYRGVALALMPVTIWMFMFINDAIVMDASQKNQWNMNP